VSDGRTGDDNRSERSSVDRQTEAAGLTESPGSGVRINTWVGEGRKGGYGSTPGTADSELQPSKVRPKRD